MVSEKRIWQGIARERTLQNYQQRFSITVYRERLGFGYFWAAGGGGDYGKCVRMCMSRSLFSRRGLGEFGREGEAFGYGSLFV